MAAVLLIGYLVLGVVLYLRARRRLLDDYARRSLQKLKSEPTKPRPHLAFGWLYLWWLPCLLVVGEALYTATPIPEGDRYELLTVAFVVLIGTAAFSAFARDHAKERSRALDEHARNAKVLANFVGQAFQRANTKDVPPVRGIRDLAGTHERGAFREVALREEANQHGQDYLERSTQIRKDVVDPDKSPFFSKNACRDMAKLCQRVLAHLPEVAAANENALTELLHANHMYDLHVLERAEALRANRKRQQQGHQRRERRRKEALSVALARDLVEDQAKTNKYRTPEAREAAKFSSDFLGDIATMFSESAIAYEDACKRVRASGLAPDLKEQALRNLKKIHEEALNGMNSAGGIKDAPAL